MPSTKFFPLTMIKNGFSLEFDAVPLILMYTKFFPLRADEPDPSTVG